MTDAPIVVDRIVGGLDAVVSVPGSKSIANRVLACAALAGGTSVVHNVPDGDDVTAMLSCLGALDVGVERDTVDNTTVAVTGRLPFGPSRATIVDTGLAGTTSRFLVGLSALSAVPITIDGAPPLRRRPFGPLLDALVTLDATVVAEHPGHLPVTVSGPAVGDHVSIRGDVSSQFITALMLIGPLLPSGLTIELLTELVSRPYVELTRSTMADFGVDGVSIGEDTITIAPDRYESAEVLVEPDASSASYPLALAAIVGGSVTVPDLGSASRQGDAAFAEVLQRMGCRVGIESTGTTVTHERSRQLDGIDIDMADISDLVPTVAAVAAIAHSPTRIRGVGFIRHKESDRLGDLAAEFAKLGVGIAETDDGLDIEPSSAQLRPGRIDPHHDHRLAMSSALLGCVIGDVTIDDPAVVAKSWPGYWDMLARVRRDAALRNDDPRPDAQPVRDRVRDVQR